MVAAVDSYIALDSCLGQESENPKGLIRVVRE